MKKRLISLLCVGATLISIFGSSAMPGNYSMAETLSMTAEASGTIPVYKGNAVVTLQNNKPSFSAEEKKNTAAFEKYSELDSLGRCGVAYANICKELMPTSPREDIYMVHPSGWQSGVGWERCHLIGFQLAGENANEKCLITGTHTFNVSSMLPYENKVREYVEQTSNHVLFRVIPYYRGTERVCRGVSMEAYSVEDNGKLSFHVFCFNVEGKDKIDYATGARTYKGKKMIPYITISNLAHTFSKDTLAAENKFNIGASSLSTITTKKISGDKNLSISKSGVVRVSTSSKPGTYKMKIKITSGENTYCKKKSIYKTVTVRISKPASTPVTSVCYWTENGSVYHLNKNCRSLANSKRVFSGTIEESGKDRACKVCSGN